MVQKQKTRFEAGPIAFVTRHELWDGNIHDHADQGVSIRVMGEVDGKETMLIRFNCFDLDRSYIYGPENPHLNYPNFTTKVSSSHTLSISTEHIE